MDGILKHMIRHQFSIQVVLDQDNKPFGLELTKLNAHRAKGKKIPETVDLSELRRLKLLTPLIQLDQHHSVDTASLYFEHGEDAIIFHHSKSIAHDDVTECLEEGLHILTAEDVTAAQLWLARS